MAKIQSGITALYERLSRDDDQFGDSTSIVNQKDNLVEGIQYAQEVIDGSMTILLLTAKGIYCARDKFGRTPVVIGKKDSGTCTFFRISSDQQFFRMS